ncbi:Hypothetical predicted protein, partial [Paramuricea clavata]
MEPIRKEQTLNQNQIPIQPSDLIANHYLSFHPNDQISVPSSLNIVHLNIRSLRNIVHLTEVKELVKLNNIDVLTISESWLNSSVTNREIAIDYYKIHRLDRLHKKGGGVCAYIKKNIKATVLKDLSK